MRKKMLYMILCMTFLGFGVLDNAHAESVFEAEKFPYKEMQIQVMPEFDYPENWPKDEPSLLVGYYGTIVNKTGREYSGAIEFPLPVKEKNFSVYLVAEFPEDNKPEVQRPYKVDNEKGVVSWQPGKPIKQDESYRFVIEYYSNPITADGSDKNFNFEFQPDAAIEALDLIVYSPMNSKGFSLQPAPASTTKSEYGQELQHYQFTNVKIGNPVVFKAAYTKEGNESALSVISKMNPPNDENHTSAEADKSLANNADLKNRPIIDAAGAAIIGGSLIIAGAFVFFGLRGHRILNASRKPKGSYKKYPKESGSKMPVIDEKKKLRSMLLNGKIDQRTYEEKMKKLI